MINGYVDNHLQAKVPISILDKNGKISALDAVVDTGFNGHLCISNRELSKINLVFSRFEKFVLRDGRPITQKVFLGYVVLGNQKVLVDVIVSQSKDTLIGAALLVDKKLEIDYTNQSVRIRNSRRKATRKGR